MSECRVVADIETTSAIKHGHIPILHPNWPDKPIDEGSEPCQFQNDAAFFIKGLQDTSSVQPPKIPCPKVKSEDWTMEMAPTQSEQPGPCPDVQPEQSGQPSSSVETAVTAPASSSQTLHNFDDSARESFLCALDANRVA